MARTSNVPTDTEVLESFGGRIDPPIYQFRILVDAEGSDGQIVEPRGRGDPM